MAVHPNAVPSSASGRDRAHSLTKHRFLANERGKLDWALVDVGDVEAFLATSPNGRKRRLIVLRQFFGFARSQRLVLADPTAGLSAKQPSGFTGQTVDLEGQRRLFRRWLTDPGRPPPRGSPGHPRRAGRRAWHADPQVLTVPRVLVEVEVGD